MQAEVVVVAAAATKAVVAGIESVTVKLMVPVTVVVQQALVLLNHLGTWTQFIVWKEKKWEHYSIVLVTLFSSLWF